MITKERAIELLDRFKSLKILVVGDIILDHYLFGVVERISPEAPVPVFEVRSEEYRLGGAANVANNIVSFGAKSYLSGIVGDDKESIILSKKLKNSNIESILFCDKTRPTTKKTRVIAMNQQLIRIDQEETHYSSKEFIDFLDENIPKDINGIIISDYAKGVITKELVEGIVLKGIFVSVDPKPSHKHFYKGATIMTPNEKEAFLMGYPEKDINKIGFSLKDELGLKALVITMGPKGAVLYSDSNSIKSFPSKAKEVYDVTGAGDTFISMLTLSLLAGASYEEALELSNIAAGIVVGKIGSATASCEEILYYID